jgi:hypothetical protein
MIEDLLGSALEKLVQWYSYKYFLTGQDFVTDFIAKCQRYLVLISIVYQAH